MGRHGPIHPKPSHTSAYCDQGSCANLCSKGYRLSILVPHCPSLLFTLEPTHQTCRSEITMEFDCDLTRTENGHGPTVIDLGTIVEPHRKRGPGRKPNRPVQSDIVQQCATYDEMIIHGKPRSRYIADAICSLVNVENSKLSIAASTLDKRRRCYANVLYNEDSASCARPFAPRLPLLMPPMFLLLLLLGRPLLSLVLIVAGVFIITTLSFVASCQLARFPG
jgi:hypothetical protein